MKIRKTETGVTLYTLRNTKDFCSLQKQAERHRTNSPSEPPEGTNPAGTFLSDSDFQNCDRIH